MSPHEEVGAAELSNLELTELTLRDPPCGQMEDRVRDGELRLAQIVTVILADPEGGRRESREPAGKNVEETPELAVVCREVTKRGEAVDHDEAGEPLLRERIYAVEGGGQASRRERGSEIFVQDGIPDQSSVEEAEGLPVAQDLVEGL